MNKYLAIDIGGYLCMNNLRALITSREVEMVFNYTDPSGSKLSVKCLVSHED